MYLSKEEKENIIEEIKVELHATFDGSHKNLIVPNCIWCGHKGGKMGIYVGPDTERKKTFMSHCFHCGKSTNTLKELLEEIGRMDLMPIETFDFNDNITSDDFSFMDDQQELDDSLSEIDMPEFYRRTHSNRYLRKRGFTSTDYEKFQVGTTRNMNFKFDDYVIFPIINDGIKVGYVSRHIWDKKQIEEYNLNAQHDGKYQIRRYKNSTDNEFVRLLYNYDSVYEDETDTVIIVEGVFDCIALTRKLNLYDNHQIAVVATFGKKISDVQMMKLQSKGVRTIVVGYDSDATASISKAAENLSEYFDVYIAQILTDDGKDWDEMDFWEIYDSFTYNLKTPAEFKLNTLQ